MFASGKAAAVSSEANYIEDVFSTYLYTGNGSTQTITNGIDLAGKGGLVWVKSRSAAYNHALIDTARTASYYLSSNSTNAQASIGTGFAFGSNGFTVNNSAAINESSQTYASWTFREQAKFFDVVTYTGNGTNGRTVAHSLGSTPGCIIVKRTDAANGWAVYHRAMNASPQDYMMRLNATDGAFTTSPSRWNNTLPTSTEFTLSGNDEVNGSGATYVAYLFAHDAGGFGLTGTDNVISCGSYTSTGSEVFVDLGYEPQFIIRKIVNATANWEMYDTMRGWSASTDQRLNPNTSDAEASPDIGTPTATGFRTSAVTAGFTYIYIAIRRGPMKVPTSGTSVFAPVTYTGNGSSQSLTAGFPIDLSLFKYRGGSTNSFEWFDRLRGTSPDLRSAYTYAELATTTEVTSFASNTQVTVGASSDTGGTNASGQTYVLEAFRRAPSFFDEVCYTGTGSATTFNHNLGVAPELMIAKERSSTGSWWVYAAPIWGTNTGDPGYDILALEQTTQRDYNNAIFNSTQPTASVFSVGGSGFDINDSGATYVNYLFASCPGVSKVGSYTGTGTTLQVNCGFTGGARFVLIKRTDSTGDWYVWDTARGIVSGNDPYLLLNSTAAETTGTDYIDTYSAGFEISSTAPAAINASGGTYIFLAIA